MNKKVAIILFIALGTALTCRSAVFLNGQRVSYHFEKNVASGGPVSTNSINWWTALQYFMGGLEATWADIQSLTGPVTGQMAQFSDMIITGNLSATTITADTAKVGWFDGRVATTDLFVEGDAIVTNANSYTSLTIYNSHSGTCCGARLRLYGRGDETDKCAYIIRPCDTHTSYGRSLTLGVPTNTDWFAFVGGNERWLTISNRSLTVGSDTWNTQHLVVAASLRPQLELRGAFAAQPTIVMEGQGGSNSLYQDASGDWVFTADIHAPSFTGSVTESDPHFSAVSNAIVYDTDPAGGDLAGTYPNPTIATGAVGSNQINWSETTLGSVGDVVITAGVAAGQSLKYDGTNWYAGTDETGGGGGGGATNREIYLDVTTGILTPSNAPRFAIDSGSGIVAPRGIVALFDTNEAGYLHYSFSWPEDYSGGTPEMKLYWSCDTVGTCVWEVAASVVTNDAFLSGRTYQAGKVLVESAITASHTGALQVLLLPLTNLNFVAGAYTTLRVGRPLESNDTITGTVEMEGCKLLVPRL